VIVADAVPPARIGLERDDVHHLAREPFGVGRLIVAVALLHQTTVPERRPNVAQRFSAAKSISQGSSRAPRCVV
jgi:hypothetical protein